MPRKPNSPYRPMVPQPIKNAVSSLLSIMQKPPVFNHRVLSNRHYRDWSTPRANVNILQYSTIHLAYFEALQVPKRGSSVQSRHPVASRLPVANSPTALGVRSPQPDALKTRTVFPANRWAASACPILLLRSCSEGPSIRQATGAISASLAEPQSPLTL